MTFTEKQNAELAAKLNENVVRARKQSGRDVSYVEGWFVIAEANRIFGFDGWVRETVTCREVCRYEMEIGQQKLPGWKVGYEAMVRVSAGGIIREGTGHGSGIARDLFDAIESAAKESETDAMKRAMVTFGNPFGLALYDKAQEGVDRGESRPGQRPTERPQVPIQQHTGINAPKAPEDANEAPMMRAIAKAASLERLDGLLALDDWRGRMGTLSTEAVMRVKTAVAERRVELQEAVPA